MNIKTENIPEELRKLPQWVSWKLQWVPSKNKYEKRPLNPLTGKPAKTSQSETWGTFAQAIECSERKGLSGIGFVLTEDDPFVAIDLDHCRDEKTGKLEDWAADVIDLTDSYTELSPSGTGVHIWMRGKKPGPTCKRGKFEMYECRRFLTFTGEHLDKALVPIQERSDQIAEAYFTNFVILPVGQSFTNIIPSSKYVHLDDENLIAKAIAAKNGPKFQSLWTGNWRILGYPSQSEADLALVSILMFWVGFDPERIDRLFRISGLYREKWERAYYREATLSKAWKPKKYEKLIMNVWDWMDGQDWSRKDGNSDWHTLLAHTGTTLDSRKTEYDAAQRTLALMVGVDRGTVQQCNRRLQARGVLAYLGKSSWGTSHWTLNISLEEVIDPIPTFNPSIPPPTSSIIKASNKMIKEDVEVSNNSNSSNHPCVLMYGWIDACFHAAWRKEGLGKGAFRMWLSLSGKDECHVRELSLCMRITEGRGTRILKKLKQHGLAERIGKGLWKARSTSLKHLDQIAEESGAARTAAQQQAKYRLEWKQNENNRHLATRDRHGKRLVKANRDIKSLQALASCIS